MSWRWHVLTLYPPPTHLCLSKIDEKNLTLEASTTLLLISLFSREGKYRKHIKLLPARLQSISFFSEPARIDTLLYLKLHPHKAFLSFLLLIQEVQITCLQKIMKARPRSVTLQVAFLKTVTSDGEGVQFLLV